MASSESPGAKVLADTAIPWDDPRGVTTVPEAMREQAAASGARRKRIARGEGGFFLNRSVLPPGYTIPPHAHDFGELIVVLAGGCTLSDGSTLGANDSVVIEANARYGFTCGDEGMEFLTLRTGEAGFDPQP